MEHNQSTEQSQGPSLERSSLKSKNSLGQRVEYDDSLVPTIKQKVITKELLKYEIDLLERSLQNDKWDKRKQIGAEIEYVLTNAGGLPLPKAEDAIEILPKLQFELSLYNVEDNTSPFPIEADFINTLGKQLRASYAKVFDAVRQIGATPVLTGILPSFEPEHFGSENFASDRYRKLNASLLKRRNGEAFELELSGQDPLTLSHPSILIEALNTSFQTHLSAPPEEIPELYNIVQFITPALLASCASSSVVFGKRVWAESRVPIWKQATDPVQVPFGDSWIKEPLELFRDLIARDPLVVREDLLEKFDSGDIQATTDSALPHLSLQNGTVWRWNRICYSAPNGLPHLRIEQRFLPAGPTISDTLANAAFYYGAIAGVRSYLNSECTGKELSEIEDFTSVKENFRAAARSGLQAKFTVFGRKVSAQEQALWLLERAKEGWQLLGVPSEEIEEQYSLLKGRITSGRTGAAVLCEKVRELSPTQITQLLQEIQIKEYLFGRALPVHEW